MTTTFATDTAENVEKKRMIEFASDVTRLADERRDIELREFVNDLHADLMRGADDE